MLYHRLSPVVRVWFYVVVHFSTKVRAFNDEAESIKNSIYCIKDLLSVYLPILPS